MKLKNAIATSAIMLGTFSMSANASDIDVVNAMYELIDTVPAAEKTTAAQEILADDWQSIGDFSGHNSSREEFVGRLMGLGKIMPDLNWEPIEIIEAGDRFIVRSRVTATPIAPLFGVDGEGRGFEVMSIDIHTVKDGKIVESFHVEDWAGALGQLKGE